MTVIMTQQQNSAALFERALRVMPGGNTRTTVYRSPHPIYARSGRGSRIVDVDSNERIDFLNNYTTLIHGHAHPAIVRAVADQLARGTCFGLPTESEIALAELLCARVPSLEHVRFTNSGSEAVMMAIKAARAFTGRPKIAKCEGSYHGAYDFAEISTDPPLDDSREPTSVAMAEGTPRSVLQDVVVLGFNDQDAMERVLAPHARDLAAVVVDPFPNRMGIAAEPSFLAALRDFTRRHGALLLFDEVISFRSGYHGAQGEVGITPDLTCIGKIIGGGFPVGAVGGRSDVMAVFDPRGGRPRVPHGGTFNANPMTMTAGLAAMELLTPAEFKRLGALGERVRRVLNEAFRAARVPGQVTGIGSLFKIHLTARPLRDFRDTRLQPAERERHDRLLGFLERGFLLGSNGAGNLSTVMTDADIDSLAGAVSDGLRDLSA